CYQRDVDRGRRSISRKFGQLHAGCGAFARHAKFYVELACSCCHVCVYISSILSLKTESLRTRSASKTILLDGLATWCRLSMSSSVSSTLTPQICSNLCNSVGNSGNEVHPS